MCLLYSVEDDEAVDEADEWEYSEEGLGVALALAGADLVQGTVVRVEDFGLIVEFEVRVMAWGCGQWTAP